MVEPDPLLNLSLVNLLTHDQKRFSGYALFIKSFFKISIFSVKIFHELLMMKALWIRHWISLTFHFCGQIALKFSNSLVYVFFRNILDVKDPVFSEGKVMCVSKNVSDECPISTVNFRFGCKACNLFKNALCPI